MSKLQKEMALLAKIGSESRTRKQPRLTQTQLQAKIQEHKKSVEVFSIWRHRKSDRLYRVMAISLREEDLEPLVTYYQVVAPGATVHFTRPLMEWLEKFEEQ